MSKSEYRQTIKAGAALSVLIEKFPATFFHFTRKPLKLRIHQDLLARGVAPDTIANGVGYTPAPTIGLKIQKAHAVLRSCALVVAS